MNVLEVVIYIMCKDTWELDFLFTDEWKELKF